MKLLKKLLSITSVIAMVLCLCPLSVAAASVTVIEAVVTEPLIGATPDFYPYIETGDAYVDSATWYRIAKDAYGTDDWETLSEDHVFETGYIYSCDMTVLAYDDSTFSPDLVGMINGQPHVDTYGSAYQSDTEAFLSIEFDSDTVDQYVSYVDAYVTEPVVGETPDMSVTVPQYMQTWVTNTETYWIAVAEEEYDAEMYTEIELTETDTFEEGYVYTLNATFTAEDGYGFDWYTDCSINGEEKYVRGYFYDPVTYVLTWTFFDLSSVDLTITTLEASVTEPLIGTTPDFYPSIVTDADAYVDSATWYRIAKDAYGIDDWETLSEDHVFETGYIYSCDMTVLAYDFGTFSPDLVGVINGQPHVDTYGSAYQSDTEAFLSIEFDSDTVDRYVSYVDAYVTEPVAGETPDMSVTVPQYMQTWVTNSYTMWFAVPEEEANSENPTMTPLTETDTFEEGYVYVISAAFSATEGYGFDNYTGCSVNGDGKNTYGSIADPDNYVISYIFFSLTSFATITDIQVTVDEPVLGATPDITPEVVCDPATEVIISDITWYGIEEDLYTGTNSDNWNILENDAVFEEGYVYSCDIYLETDYGYLFDQYATASMNGMPHVDTYGPAIESYYTAYICGEFFNLTVAFENATPGDVNNDGDITLADAMQAFYHVNEKITLEGDGFAAADLDGNGEISLGEAMKIFYFVNEKIDTLV